MGAQRAHNRETTEKNTVKSAIIQADLAGTGLPSQRFISGMEQRWLTSLFTRYYLCRTLHDFLFIRLSPDETPRARE